MADVRAPSRLLGRLPGGLPSDHLMLMMDLVEILMQKSQRQYLDNIEVLLLTHLSLLIPNTPSSSNMTCCIAARARMKHCYPMHVPHGIDTGKSRFTGPL